MTHVGPTWFREDLNERDDVTIVVGGVSGDLLLVGWRAAPDGLADRRLEDSPAAWGDDAGRVLELGLEGCGGCGGAGR